MWGHLSGEAFSETIAHCYKKIVHWKRNMFKVPTGKAGNLFVKELTRLIDGYVSDSALQSVALRAAMVLPSLVLQKPSRKSKTKEYARLIVHRLKLWQDGQLTELIDEGETIQRRLRFYHQSQPMAEDNTKYFTRLMSVGKVKAAMRLLKGESSGGPLPLHQVLADSNETVLDVLKSKHPPPHPVSGDAIDPDTAGTQEPHPVLFERIDSTLIRSTVMKMDGAAGPSGLDTASWKRLCTAFKSYSSDLCTALASLCRKICTQYLDPRGLAPLVAGRLVALDKCPGVRPIGIGECLRRILCKAIASVLSMDILDSVGALQLCAGHTSGCEAAVHAVRTIFDFPETEAFLTVDATNAFNSLNRRVALKNVMKRCPPLSRALINTYRSNIDLYINGESLLSQEGTTQGDPLAMAMYAVATVPLIEKIANDGVKQTWYADDAAAGGDLVNIKKWWDDLQRLGPDYGYIPNPRKTQLLVKDHLLDAASDLFRETGITVCSEGTRYLGAAIGTDTFVKSFIQGKVGGWVHEVKCLSTIAVEQPQSAYAAFTHGVRSRWNYLMRTMPGIEVDLQPLEDMIRQKFLPALTGQNQFGNEVRDLLALPARVGGLGLISPIQEAVSQFRTSVKVTTPLVKQILHQSKEYPSEAVQELLEIKNEIRQDKQRDLAHMELSVSGSLSNTLKKAKELASEKGASSWLTALPIAEHGFCLHKGAFRDALCLRYNWRPPRLPSHCECGSPFQVDHALSCPYGGFPSIRHDELRDLTAHLLTEVCHNVGIEPELQPLDGVRMDHRTANVEDGARLDIKADNFWSKDRQTAFFDIRVFNPLAPSYRNQVLATGYRKNEQEKRRAYEQRVREVEHGCFTPLVFSASGGMGPSAKLFYKKLASMISQKYDAAYNRTLSWMRCRLSFSLLRSAVMCLRGSRSSKGRPALPVLSDFELALSEGQVSP